PDGPRPGLLDLAAGGRAVPAHPLLAVPGAARAHGGRRVLRLLLGRAGRDARQEALRPGGRSGRRGLSDRGHPRRHQDDGLSHFRWYPGYRVLDDRAHRCGAARPARGHPRGTEGEGLSLEPTGIEPMAGEPATAITLAPPRAGTRVQIWRALWELIHDLS